MTLNDPADSGEDGERPTLRNISFVLDNEEQVGSGAPVSTSTDVNRVAKDRSLDIRSAYGTASAGFMVGENLSGDRAPAALPSEIGPTIQWGDHERNLRTYTSPELVGAGTTGTPPGRVQVGPRNACEGRRVMSR